METSQTKAVKLMLKNGVSPIRKHQYDLAPLLKQTPNSLLNGQGIFAAIDPGVVCAYLGGLLYRDGIAQEHYEEHYELWYVQGEAKSSEDIYNVEYKEMSFVKKVSFKEWVDSLTEEDLEKIAKFKNSFEYFFDLPAFINKTL